jgi:hypothetical protein
MQYLNNGSQQVQSGWFNSCVNVDSSINVKKFIKSFKYNCKTSNCMGFNIF